MSTLQTIRANSRAELEALLAKLDRRHKALVRNALEKYGSVEAIPTQFWTDMQRDIEDELAASAVLLFLIMASDEWTTREIRKQGAELRGVSSQGAVDYSVQAARQAQRMAQGTVATIRDRLAVAVEERPGNARYAVEEVFTDTRRERIAGTEVVRGSSTGQVGAGHRASRGTGFGDDGAATVDGQRVRVDLIWRNHPERSRSGPCPRCEPLDGQPEAVWGLRFPEGPPSPHTGCVCTLEPRVIAFGGST